MTALVWPVAFVLTLGVCGLVGAYDKVQRRLDQEAGCACPTCDAGGSCAKDGVS
jgi:hypothetical protein